MSSMIPSPTLFFRLVLALWIGVCFATPTNAATYYWNSYSPNWAQSSNPALWVGTSGAPAAGTRWSITAGGTATINDLPNGSDVVISKTDAKISFTTTAATPILGTLSITSGTTTFTGLYTSTSQNREMVVTGAVTGNFNVDDSNTSAGFHLLVALQNSNSATALNGTVSLLTNSGGAAGAGQAILRLDHQNAVGTNSFIAMNTDGVLRLNTTPASGTDTYTLGRLSGTAVDARVDDASASYNGQKILRVEQSTDTTFSGQINRTAGGSGSLGLTKAGNGKLTLTGTSNYNGATLIAGGALVLSGSSSMNGSSGVTVDGGTLNYSSSTNLTALLTFTSGTLAGANFAGHSLSIGSNQTISPGNSTGTMVSAAQTWAGGGTYVWEMNDATGTVGADGWDLLSINGALTITATAGSKFNLLITSLAGQVAGQAANFNSLMDGAWLIADATNAITTFDASAFNLNLTGFQNAYAGVWSVALGGSGAFGGDSSQIYLTYSAIPEPSTTLLLAGAILSLTRFRRRQPVSH